MPDGLTLAEGLVVLVLLAALIPVMLLVARRRWLSRAVWVFDCSLRLAGATPGSWMLGVARLNGELIEWYRVFSWSLFPKITLSRGNTSVRATRGWNTDERAELVDQGRIVALSDGSTSVELAMSDERMTAFLAWIEAAPPGLGYR